MAMFIATTNMINTFKKYSCLNLQYATVYTTLIKFQGYTWHFEKNVLPCSCGVSHEDAIPWKKGPRY